MQVSRRIIVYRSLLLTALFLIATGLLVLAFRPQTLRGTVIDANGPVAPGRLTRPAVGCILPLPCTYGHCQVARCLQL